MNYIKLNLGAGSDIREGFINQDIVQLPGINCVHNLNLRPWPWGDSSASEIMMLDVLEHLDQLLPTIEEVWRVVHVGGTVKLSVPYWNSWTTHADPTHKRGFHEKTFSFFDPDSEYCKERSYYTQARFSIEKMEFVLAPFVPYFAIPFVGEIVVRRRFLRAVVSFLANHFMSNLIHDLRVELKRV